MPAPVWQDLSQRISKELDIPADNLILAAEHVHSAPSVAGAYEKGSPATIAYTAKLKAAAFEAVRRAKANLQPARFGFGTGKAYVNINRREYFPKDGWWWIGGGIWVIKVDSSGYPQGWPVLTKAVGQDAIISVASLQVHKPFANCLHTTDALHGHFFGALVLQLDLDLPKRKGVV